MLALFLAPAWAGTWTILLPPDQRAAEWEEALELTGLTLAASESDSSARFRCTQGTCLLYIRNGDSWRSTTIPAPSSAEAREQIALKARSMLQARAEVHNTWQPDLGDFLEAEPPPAQPLPTFEIPAPPLAPFALTEPPPTRYIPHELATWSEALRPQLIISERPPLLLWGAASASGEQRSMSGPGVSGGVSGGISMLSSKLGLGLDLSGHSPTRVDASRAWSTWGAAGMLWVRPSERIQFAGLIGGHRLRFTDSGSVADTVQRTFAAADLSTPLGPLWLTARFTSDLSPITLYEVDQLGREEVLVEPDVLWSAAVGVRWWVGQ
ncbi:MAG: hypothetical protein P8R54_09670 [Myxococcota bacterium]|nr:hypothetical protein [Myxococcota bacterium]